jgi:hypothetical protein
MRLFLCGAISPKKDAKEHNPMVGILYPHPPKSCLSTYRNIDKMQDGSNQQRY